MFKDRPLSNLTILKIDGEDRLVTEQRLYSLQDDPGILKEFASFARIDE